MDTFEIAPGLLAYNSSHKVLICSVCQYAIQKNAAGSHLLKHKVYRNARKETLQKIAELELLDSRDVPLPGPNAPPIQSLPVLQGRKCAAAGCQHLCASEKRMRRHWTESRHEASRWPIGEPDFVMVKMQTFFRGRENRYFEVAIADDVSMDADPAPSNARVSGTPEPRSVEEEEEGGGGSLSRSSSVACSGQRGAEMHHKPLDLRVLMYFHHFLANRSTKFRDCSAASRTLGNNDFEDVIALALRTPCVMYGLLWVAATDLELETEDASERRMHGRFSQIFADECRQVLHPSDPAIVQGGETSAGSEPARWDEAAAAVSQLLGLQSAIVHQSIPFVNEVRLGPLHRAEDLTSMLNCLRNVGRPILPYECKTTQQALDTLHARQASLAESMQLDPATLVSESAQQHQRPGRVDASTRVIATLVGLPERMSAIYDKPSTVTELNQVGAVISAIANLVECCEVAYSTVNPRRLWPQVARWAQCMPDDFAMRVLDCKPAALVVVAHFATLLLRRAERHGCWYFDGLTDKMLHVVMEELSKRDALSWYIVDELTKEYT